MGEKSKKIEDFSMELFGRPTANTLGERILLTDYMLEYYGLPNYSSVFPEKKSNQSGKNGRKYSKGNSD